MKDEIRKFICEVSGHRESDLKDEMTLGDLQLDSLDAIEIACLFEDAHPDVSVDETRFIASSTVKEVGDYLESLI